VFYDLGANNGYLSLLAASRVGPTGWVYAFEPPPENARRLQELLTVNGIENYQLVSAALSDQSGQADFYLSENENGYVPSLIQGRRNKTIRVATLTLTEFCAQQRWPTLIKMDVEGAEALVLAGAQTVLASQRSPIWLIEIHSDELERQVCAQLRAHNYSLQSLPSMPPRQNRYPKHLLAWPAALTS
jgi:FkbM family methyltransferase